MTKRIIKATDFKRAAELAAQGRVEEAKILLKGLQDEFLALCEENATFRRQMEEVSEILDLSECMEFDGQKYWLMENFRKKGPYCQVCYDRDAILMRLQEHEKHWQCHHCGGLFLRRDGNTRSAERAQAAAKSGKTIPLFQE